MVKLQRQQAQNDPAENSCLQQQIWENAADQGIPFEIPDNADVRLCAATTQQAMEPLLSHYLMVKGRRDKEEISPPQSATPVLTVRPLA